MKTKNLLKNMTKATAAFLFAAAMTVGFTSCNENGNNAYNGASYVNELTASHWEAMGAQKTKALEKAYEKQHFIKKDRQGRYYITPIGIREYLNGQDKLSGKTFKEFMDDLNGGTPIIDAKYIKKGKSYNVSQDALGEGFLSNFNYERTSNYLTPEYYQTKEAKLAIGKCSELLNKDGIAYGNNHVAYNSEILE